MCCKICLLLLFTTANRKTKMFNKLIQAFNFSIKLFLSGLICLILLRFIESYIIIDTLKLESFFWLKALNGVFFDLFTWLFICSVISLIFLPLYFIKNGKLFFWSTATLSSLVLIINIGLSIFFFKQFQPLDEVVFTYNISDMKYAGESSSGSNIFPVFLLIVLPLLFLILLYFQKNINWKKPFRIIFFAAMLISIIACNNIYYPMEIGFMGQYVTNNKLGYFMFKTYKYFEEQNRLNKLISDVNADQKISDYIETIYKRKPENINYPLLKKTKLDNVLKPYFNLKETAPNVVFIIVESLSKSFVGDDAKLGSYTPFLDSLAKRSLYFPNFLSTCERTFNVLPSTLGSLPYAKNGFMDYGFNNKLPLHYTLVDYFGRQNYYSRFYVGCYPGFNNMFGFLRSSNIDYIVNNWQSKFLQMETDEKGYGWGYPDKALFEKSFDDLDVLKINKPRFDILLTVTSHAPFIPPDKLYYENKFDEIFKQYKYSNKIKQEVSSYKKQLSTILYTDEAIRYYFKKAAEMHEDENTIYIIFGDHAMPEIDLNKSPLEKFHVPLFIYSKLLKGPKQINSVSTHLDLPLTIISLLSEKYKFDYPKQNAFLGTVLDTNSNYVCNRSIPFILNSKAIDEFIMNDVFYFRGKTYTVKENLEIEPNDDKVKKGLIAGLIDGFKLLNIKTVYQNRLYDSKLKSHLLGNRAIETKSVKSVDLKKNNKKIISEFTVPAISNIEKIQFELKFFNEKHYEGKINLKVVIRDKEGKVIYDYMQLINAPLKDKNRQSYTFQTNFGFNCTHFNLRNARTVSFELENPNKETFSVSEIMFSVSILNKLN